MLPFLRSWFSTAGTSLRRAPYRKGNGLFLRILICVFTITAGAYGQSPPAITEQPVNEVVSEGWTATFHAQVTGTTPLQYQWQRDGANIVGAARSAYTTAATTLLDNGAVFNVRVSNAYGSVLSNRVILTVQAKPAASPAPSPPSTLPAINHIFIVAEENHSYSEIIGSGAMPYLQSLADLYGLAVNFFANTHPSVGNYFVLTTGQIISNDDKYMATVYEDNIVRHLVTNGKTWREYTENLPSVGYYGAATGGYVPHHNTLSYFSDVRDDPVQRNNLVPFTQLSADLAAGQLPNYALIIPTNAHNGHDGPLPVADQWLQTNIAPLITDPQFQRDGLLFIVFDEGRPTDVAYGGGQVACVVIGPSAKTAYQSTAFYQQQNILKTVCDLLGLGSFPAPSLATNAAVSMAEFLVDGPTLTPTPTPTPTPTLSPEPSVVPTPTPTLSPEATVVPTPTPPLSSADLKVSVTDGRTTTVAGWKSTYTIVVANSGPSEVTGAVVNDAFPASFNAVTFTATQSGGASGFTAAGSGSINDTLTMPVASTVTYKATGTVSSSATGSISNTATISAPIGVTDSFPADNNATDTDTIKLRAALRVTVNDGKTAAVAGAKNTYTIAVTNFGPSDVTGAVVSDSFPADFTGVTFTTTQSASGFTAAGSGNINDTVMMPSGSKITYKAAGTISSAASGTLSDTATVTAPSGVTDPNLTNNTATDTDTL